MHTLPELSYAYGALEPYIDKETMMIHHTKHHQGYVQNLNKALEGNNDLMDKDLLEILSDLPAVPENIRVAVQNNGGGHFNHSFFWEVMAPATDSNREPSGDLAKAISESFGDFVKFKEAFSDSGMKRFGSGWAWLVVNKNKELEIYSTPNQDNPIMKGDRPVLGVDVWEHAYYLKYQNRRKDYLNNFWPVVNWPIVETHYEAAIK